MVLGVVAVLMTCRIATTAVADQTILMVDDHGVLYRSGTHRVLHPAVPHTQNPVLAETKPWEQAIGYCSVYRDPDTGRHQLWYQAYSGSFADDPTRRVVVCYAESDDGVTWIKPDLGLFPYNGIEQTNIVLIGNGGRSTNYGAAVIVDPRDSNPARRYKMAYWDFAVVDGQEYPGLCVAFSADGIRWEKHPQAPLLRASYGTPGAPPLSNDDAAKAYSQPMSLSDVIDLMYDPRRERFVIYGKTWLDGPDGKMFWKRATVRTESQDFIHWSAPQLMLAPDEFEVAQGGAAAGIEIHGAPVFYHAGVYFGLLQILDFGGVGTMPGELAVSRDGLQWRRPFRGDYFLPVTGKGETFDSGCLWTNAMPVFLEDEIRFYYGAYPGWNHNNKQTGIGLRSIPRDRFAGIRPLEQIGQVTLRAIDLSGETQLSLNANAAIGSVRVELLTADGYRVAGFTKDDAIAIEADGLRLAVGWTGKSLDDLPPGRYRLRLHLQNAEIFAVSVK